MDIRILKESDAQAWWNLRLQALTGEPKAFGKSPEEHIATPVDAIAKRFRESTADAFTPGAFEAGRLIGIATFMRRTGLKELHKGELFGVYVDPDFRRRGVARELIESIRKSAQQDPSLEQILLSVSTAQPAACALYRSLGFLTYGTEPNALKIGDSYIDEDHMILRLR
jgi:ribosomal protein S18 acetylase RimI-like enzyme